MVAPLFIFGNDAGGFDSPTRYALDNNFQAVAGGVNPLVYGADPTGVLDSTAAFNRATLQNPNSNIRVPAGTFKLNGSVVVYSGQTFVGSGHATIFNLVGTPPATPTFICGGQSGLPLKIGDFYTIGGSATAGVIKMIQAGFEIASVFMTFPGVGIDFNNCTDGLVDNIEIDQSLTAWSFTGSQNIAISTFNIYLPNYAITMSGSSDIVLANGVIEYPQFNAVLYQGTKNNAIAYEGVKFLLNAQFPTFSGFLNYQVAGDYTYTGCTFQNMAGPAINHNTGVGPYHKSVGCTFNGAPSVIGYTPSTTAAVLATCANGAGQYLFDGCAFKNLLGGTWNAVTYGALFTVETGLGFLRVTGGSVDNVPINRWQFNQNDVPNISLKGVAGIGFVNNSGTNQTLVLPYWGASTDWRVGVKGDTFTTGSTFYKASEEGIYSVSYQFTTSGNTFLDKALLWQTPNRAIPGLLNAVGTFGNVAGGAVSIVGVSNSGNFNVSVPTSTAANFSWFAETVE